MSKLIKIIFLAPIVLILLLLAAFGGYMLWEVEQLHMYEFGGHFWERPEPLPAWEDIK